MKEKNAKGNSRHYWNFYGVHITNPAPKNKNDKLAGKNTKSNATAKNVPPIVKPLAVKPTLASKIIFKGKVIDAKTNHPIVGKIITFSENTNKKVDSVQTSNTGEYTLELKPDAYSFTASAKGYETNQESIDLSKITGKGNFTKNFELNPLDEAVPTAKEILLPDTVKTEEKPVAVEENKFRLDKVYFNIGEANLLPASYPQLEGLLKMMKANPAMTIEVQGHTDNVGEAVLNKRLSLDRAFSVRQYLIDKGIAGNRVKFKGYGDGNPIATNETEEGRKQNRRVEFLILSQ